MFTDSKVIEIFCLADEFCKFFDSLLERCSLESTSIPLKRKYYRAPTPSKAEGMLILIMFHVSGYRCLKHYYLEYVCVHLRHLFPELVSYNRFVEPEKDVALPLAIFIKKVLLGKCTGVSFVDSTVLRVCRNQRIQMHKVFKEYIGKKLFEKLFADGIQLITKLKSNMKGAITKVSDRVLLRKRAIIETINDELKNIAQIEHSGHRSFHNFVVNLLSGVAAYCFFPKKPSMNIEKVVDSHLLLHYKNTDLKFVSLKRRVAVN